MRVLLITGEFPPLQGGVGDYTYEIARGLAPQDIQVQVLTSQLAKERSLTTPLIGGFSTARNISKWNWASTRVIAGTIQDFAPDIVDIQYQTGAYGMHPAINFLPRLFQTLHRETKISFVATFHDLRIPYLFPKAGPLRDWVTRVLARSCHAVIATNEQDYARLARWGIPHVFLIPIGSNIATTAPPGYDRSLWRARLGVAGDEYLLCHFGFVNARKGCETLVRALAQIPNAKLLMIGGQTGSSDPTNAKYYAALENAIAELGLQDRVLWTGYTAPEIVTANFFAADLCVLPYREGATYQHGTLMAALAHGMPIVTTLPRGSQEIAENMGVPQLRDGKNCLLVPPDDPEALAGVIRRARGSPELCSKIRQGACELSGHFTWDKIVQQHLELYDRLRVAL